MILQKKEELANRQLRLTITVERDAWEKALNDAYQEVKALYPVEGYAVGKAPREALEKAYSHDLFYQEAVNEPFPAALVEAIASEDIQIAISFHRPRGHPDRRPSRPERGDHRPRRLHLHRPHRPVSGGEAGSVQGPVRPVGECRALR